MENDSYQLTLIDAESAIKAQDTKNIVIDPDQPELSGIIFAGFMTNVPGSAPELQAKITGPDGRVFLIVEKIYKLTHIEGVNYENKLFQVIGALIPNNQVVFSPKSTNQGQMH